MKNKLILKKRDFILSFLSITLLFISYYNFIPFIYQVNDDLLIKNLLTGLETGEVVTHVVHLNYLFSSIVGIFYRINASIPWFGILLMFSHFISLVFVSEVILQKFTKLKNKIIISILYFLTCFFIWMPLVAQIQYTSVAGILSATAIFLYIAGGKLNVRIVILVLVSCGLRDKMMFLATPYACAACFLMWLKEKDRFNRTTIMKYVKDILILLGVIALFVLANFIAYSQEPWKEFDLYNSSREKLFDYNGKVPIYQENEALYDSLGITKESYEALTQSSCYIFDENINSQSLSILAEKTSKEGLSIEKLGITFLEYIKWSLNTRNMLFVVLLMLAVYFFLIGLFDRKNRIFSFTSIGIIVVFRTLVWMFIFYEGRYPPRIVDSLFMIELLLYLGLLLNVKLGIKVLNKIQIAIVVVMTLLMSFVFFNLGFKITKTLHVNTWNFIEITEPYNELKEFVGNNKDNFYYYNIQLGGYGNDTEKILTFNEEPLTNRAFIGGWLANSPWYEDKFDLWGIENPQDSLMEDHVYLVFETTHTAAKSSMFKYLRTIYQDADFEVADTLITETGVVYEFIQVVY